MGYNAVGLDISPDQVEATKSWVERFSKTFFHFIAVLAVGNIEAYLANSDLADDALQVVCCLLRPLELMAYFPAPFTEITCTNYSMYEMKQRLDLSLGFSA